MSLVHFLLLIAAGFGAGLTGSVAGLASLVSYPALLALGLSPLAANVTNTIGLLSNGPGSAAGARAELRGHGRRIAMLSVWSGVGGALGAGLLLWGSSATFKQVVPWLIALGSLLLLVRDPLRGWLDARQMVESPAAARRSPSWGRRLPVLMVGIYGGYFGAGAGVIMLAVLSLETLEPLPVTNAVKNLTMTAANCVAAVIFAFDSPVHWPAAAAIAIGVLGGSWCGPAVVRIVPDKPLRVAIALAGLGLAVALFIGWSGS
ncbi:MAG TPA: sulfite exporter TauE/SafE family protein [Solirubrobacteraceae bacterium]|jgi:hypothetical protein|nr:sulfite exporter TauE/SafE family protein [Solirubrobacteraceae bacterium]